MILRRKFYFFFIKKNNSGDGNCVDDGDVMKAITDDNGRNCNNNYYNEKNDYCKVNDNNTDDNKNINKRFKCISNKSNDILD